MNLQAIIGLLGVVALMVCGILLGSPLFIFVDVPSVLITVGGTVALLTATHGLRAWFAAVGGGFVAMLTNGERLDVETHEHNAHIAQSGGTLCICMGVMGATIGLIQMLANLEDPTAIGPAMAVALLTSFYAVMLNLLVFVPVSRYHREMARTPNG